MSRAKLLYFNPLIDRSLDRFELHAFVGAFPVILLAGAFMADVASLYTVQAVWRPIAMWLLSIGLIAGGVAALTGALSYVNNPAARTVLGWGHSIGMSLALLLVCVNIAVRLSEPTKVVTPTQIGISTVTFLLLLIAGLLTGELVFRLRLNKPALTVAV
jgi:uncharacterized membrane protein